MLNANQVMGIENSHIVPLDDNHFLLPAVKDAFKMMQQAAIAQNLDLQICSSFRSFDKQLSIWNRKWLGELPLYALSGDALDAHTLSDHEKIHAIMLWSALPGASRHHWGSDFDFYDKANVARLSHCFELVTHEYSANGPCAELATWVHTHANAFGFYLPYANYVGGVAQEPWHLSHKDSAQAIQTQFDIKALAQQLQASEILGKETILAQLPNLVERYTYNKGK